MKLQSVRILAIFILLILPAIVWIVSPPMHTSARLIAVANTNENESLQDRDYDGVPDDMDVCPTIPGNLINAINQDGCPTVPGFSPQHTSPGISIYGPDCNMCPCPTLDYQADIRWGDIIFAILSDTARQTIYTTSNLYYITE